MIFVPNALRPSFVFGDAHGGRYTSEVLGIITVEDVLEELIGEEIYDEDDYAQMYLSPLPHHPPHPHPHPHPHPPAPGESEVLVPDMTGMTALAAAQLSMMASTSASALGKSPRGGDTAAAAAAAAGAAAAALTFERERGREIMSGGIRIEAAAAGGGGGGGGGGATSGSREGRVGSHEVELPHVNLADHTAATAATAAAESSSSLPSPSSSFQRPCVLAAVRKFRLMAERGRRRRLQRSQTTSSVASVESCLGE